MRPARASVGVSLLAAGNTRYQDKDRKGEGPAKSAAKGQLPRYWDRLGLTAAQREEIRKVTAEEQRTRARLEEEGRKLAPGQNERRAHLREAIRDLHEEAARQRVAVLTDAQRKKLIDLLTGPARAEGPGRPEGEGEVIRGGTPTATACRAPTPPPASGSAGSSPARPATATSS